MTLHDSVCVVKGASSGIGRALALALALEGGQVWAIGRNRARLDSLVAEATKNGSEIHPVVADLELRGDLESIAREVLSVRDRVDVLVHVAGALSLGALESLSATEIDRQCFVNLRAPIVLTQMLPALRRARGQVVFMNSLAAFKASANNAVYAATKAGLKTFADGSSRRGELGRRARDNCPHRSDGDAAARDDARGGRQTVPGRAPAAAEGRRRRRAGRVDAPRNGEVTDVSVRPMVKLPPA